MSGENLFTRGAMHQGAWLVYVNGLEVPCPQVTVNYGVWAIPEATISFPPHRLLERLGREDRIDVVVFFLDDLTDSNKPEFKLLFEGEIIGWSYRNTANGRMMSFNVIADISIFTQLYFFFVNTVDAVMGMQQPGWDANSIGSPGAFYPFSLFKKGLISAKPADGKVPADIKRPFEIIYNVLRAICAHDLPLTGRSIPAVNFFSRWVRKRNFINRFAALPLFEDTDGVDGVFPIFQAVQATTALDTMQQNLAATVGEQGNMFQMFQTILGHVYFELAMIPTAPCFRVNLSDGVIIGPASDPPKTAKQENPPSTSTPPPPTTNTNTQPLRLINYFVKPQMLFGMPPMCNVVFPSMSPSFSYSENYIGQPTRIYMNDQFVSNMINQNQITAAALTVGYPLEINALLDQKTGQNGKVSGRKTETGKNCLVFPEEFFKGPVISRRPVPEWFTYLQNKNKGKKEAAWWQKPKDAAQEAAAALTEGQTSQLSKLYALYTKYEYYRCRYEKRGGACDLAFNPFIVPGFPCVVFDNRTSAFDLVGYMMNATQTFSSEGGGSAGSMSSAFNFGFGRTIQEVLELLVKDMDSLGIVLGMAPAEPIDNVRTITQDPDQAETFYKALFHGRTITNNRKAAFDYRQAIGYTKSDGTVEPIWARNNNTISVQQGGTAPGATAAALESPQTGPTSEAVSNPEYKIIVDKVTPLLTQLDTLGKELSEATIARKEATTSEDYTTLLQVEGHDRERIADYAARIMFEEGLLSFWNTSSFSPGTKDKLKTIVFQGAPEASSSVSIPSSSIPALKDPTTVHQVLVDLLAYAETIRYTQKPPESAAAATSSVAAFGAISHNIDMTREIQPTENYAEFFDNYDAAMAYIARPICTLKEYIRFIHREKADNRVYTDDSLIEALQQPDAAGVVQVRSPIYKMGYAYQTKSSATYYERIYKLRQGPKLNGTATPPTPAQTGVEPPTAVGVNPLPYAGKPAGVAVDFVQTRNDWDSILEEYRAEMYNQEAPQR